MEQYIPKAAVVAEIDKRRNFDKELQLYSRLDECNGILSFIDTLEVKEVDFDKEIDNIWNPRFNLGWDEKSLLSMNHEGFTTIAKHFFELGMAASNKAQKGEKYDRR